MDDNRWCGKITLNADEMLDIFESYDIHYYISLEDLVAHKIGNKFPENVSKEDKASYVGVIASLLWNYYSIDNIAQSITIRQKIGGDFVVSTSK